MEKPEGNRKKVVLRSVETSAQTRRDNDKREVSQPADSKCQSEKRDRRNSKDRDKKDRQGSTTHDGRGSEMF